MGKIVLSVRSPGAGEGCVGPRCDGRQECGCPDQGTNLREGVGLSVSSAQGPLLRA